MNLYLFPHGGSGNHGCEAIVRSTVKIIGEHTISLFSSRPSQDYEVGLERICNIYNERKTISRFELGYLWASIKFNLLHDKNAYERLSFSPIFDLIRKEDILLSIGGDNYCYGIPEYILFINKELRKKGVKTILWGCSIEPKSIQGKMLEDLKGYDHIFTRESITYQALKSQGINKLSLYPDPAFQLDRIDLPLPERYICNNTVGINVSPMIIAREKNKGITLQNIKTLIHFIIDNTDMQVALIPHVVWPHNDDRKPLDVLYNQFKETGRVILIGDHNAEELKGFIARCRFMIAARTHASIAAYSQKVPTLVLGYSVKARGIATDIFGNDSHYVIPVQSLQQPNELTTAFLWLMENEQSIRNHYAGMMDDYINQGAEMNKDFETILS